MLRQSTCGFTPPRVCPEYEGVPNFNAAEDAMELPTKPRHIFKNRTVSPRVGKLLFPVYGGKKNTTPAGFEPALPEGNRYSGDSNLSP
jgi:hypothetical protein